MQNLSFQDEGGECYCLLECGAVYSDS